MKKPAREKSFKTEVELCQRFLSAVGEDWTSFSETAGWDILLVRKSDGFQIGIEAKLKLNMHVITQAIETGNSYSALSPGPDCRAVLVPDEPAGSFDLIAGYIGFTIIRVSAPDRDVQRFGKVEVFRPYLPRIENVWGEQWFECAPARRHELPEYVPDVPAGAAAPVQLTSWKISAIKIAITLELRGYVTRADFKHHGIDYRRFIAPEYGWLRVEDGRYVRGARFPDFTLQHPKVYQEISADSEKWLLAPKSAESRQGTMI